MYKCSVKRQRAIMKKISEIAIEEENFKTMTKLVKPMLEMLGAWPLSDTASFRSRLLKKLVNFVTLFLFFMIIIPSFLHIALIEKNNEVKLKQLGLIINWITQLGKYMALLCGSKEIQIGLDVIKEDCMSATKEHLQIFHSNAKIAQRMLLIVACIMYGGGVFYRIILPLMKPVIVTPENITIRPLPSPSYFVLFTAYPTPNYEIIFTMQVLGGVALYAIMSGCAGACALLVLHTCSMLKILIKMIKDLTENENMSELSIQHRLSDLVRYQVRIKRFLNNVSGVTDYICFIEMFGGTVVTCLGLNVIVTEWEHGNTLTAMVFISLVSCCSACIFVMCYIGQLLLDEDSKVEVTSCTVKWYRLPSRHVRDLIPIIAMSRYPMKLTAGKMMDMSLTSFTDTVKVAVGYFNVLHNSI